MAPIQPRVSYDHCCEHHTMTNCVAAGKCTCGVEQTEDNWKHRSAKMRCRTCMYFVVKEGQAPKQDGNYLGRCRRHAPTMSGFPAVFSEDWCGDHKLDEGKIG